MDYTIINIKEDDNLIDAVIALGDSQKQTLGFLPTQAFIEYAARGSILVALSKERVVVGYVLFAYKKSNICRLAHVCVDPSWRKKGVGNSLIKCLKSVTANTSSIIVRCRRDYGIDQFWVSNGFVAKGEGPGRGSSGATLTLWEYRHQLSLLSLPSEGSQPLIVLDLNVVIEDMQGDENESRALFSFTYADEIDFRVSKHSYIEANRSEDKECRDLTRSRLNSLKHIELCQDPGVIQLIVNIIGETNLDDARQIASAVCSNADCFITKDTGITKYSEEIQKEFGLSVCTPTEFVINYCNGSGRDLYFPGYLNSSEIVFKPIESFSISALFQEYKDADERKHSFENSLCINSPDTKKHSFFHIVVKDQEIGICAQSKVEKELIIRMLRLKKTIKHMHTLSAHIVESILYMSSSTGISNIVVTDKSSGRLVDSALIDTGFQKRNGCFTKPMGSGFIRSIDALEKIGLEPSRDFTSSSMDLLELENTLWPAKILDLNIPIYIFPIKPKWAKKLISNWGHQLSLTETSNIMLQTRRVYYRSKQGLRIDSPARIIWYASENDQHGLGKCGIGLSLINHVEIGPAKQLFKKYERFGVYTWEDLHRTAKNDPAKHLMAIVFSKTELFKRTLDFHLISETIQTIEGRVFNPVSPFAISQESFREMYRLGTDHGY
jgi:hypothetical protein